MLKKQKQEEKKYNQLNLLSLPTELLLIIAKKLLTRDIVYLALTCRTFYRVFVDPNCIKLIFEHNQALHDYIEQRYPLNIYNCLNIYRHPIHTNVTHIYRFFTFKEKGIAKICIELYKLYLLSNFTAKQLEKENKYIINKMPTHFNSDQNPIFVAVSFLEKHMKKNKGNEVINDFNELIKSFNYNYRNVFFIMYYTVYIIATTNGKIEIPGDGIELQKYANLTSDNHYEPRIPQIDQIISSHPNVTYEYILEALNNNNNLTLSNYNHSELYSQQSKIIKLSSVDKISRKNLVEKLNEPSYWLPWDIGDEEVKKK